MKVLHIYKTYFPEDRMGVARFIHELAEETAKSGIENHVLAVYRRPHEVPGRIGSHFIHPVRRHGVLWSTPCSLHLPGRYRTLSRSVDMVHYHFPWPVSDLLHLISPGRRPSLVTYHSDIVKQRLAYPFYRPVMNLFLSRVDAIVATSPNYMRTSETLIRWKDKTRPIPIGIRDAAPVERGLLSSVREKAGSDFFLFVGAARYYKGLSFLIEAARISGLPVVLAGEHGKAAFDRRRIPPNVRLMGPVSDAEKRCLLQLCRAFVLPSHLRSEAFGIALVEAAQAGRPMISCEIGTGTSFVNVDKETGLVVRPADAAALAAAMTALAGDDLLAARLGANAARRCRALFSASDMARQYVDLYRGLLPRQN